MRISFLLFALLLTPAAFAADAAPLSAAMPKGAVGYMEINDLGQRLIQLRDSAYYADALDSPQIKQSMKQPQYKQYSAGRKIAEAYLGMNLWTAADKLFGKIAVGIYPKANSKQPDVAAMIRVTDPAAWAHVRERIEPLLVLARDSVKRETRGELELLTLSGNNGKVFVAFHKNWLAAASTPALLDQSIAGLRGEAKQSVAHNPAFKKMERDMGAEHFVSAWTDLGYFRKLAGKRFSLPEKYKDGFVSLMFSGIIELAMQSDYLGLTLDADKAGLKLAAGIEGDPKALGEKFGWFFSEAGTPGTRDVPAVPGLMGGLSIHRKLSGWYGKREALMDERLQAGFDKFESDLGTIFPGRDIGDDIMPAFGSTITFLAAKQSFKHFKGEPGIKLPGFALLFDLNRPADGNLFQLVFQTIVTITNFAGAEQGGREPSVMTAVVHEGVAINTIQYLRPPQGERLDLSYNFIPCAATVNGRFVFCTSLELLKSLVTELKKPQNPQRVNRNFNFELHPPALAGLVADNRRTLVAKNIQTGKPAEQARAEIQLAERLLKAIKILRFSTSVKDKGFQIQLEGKWAE
ncbi:MAG: hypothetical protein H8E27_00325 [Verrucomicrobia subdivision 3 bacterium]|nr:hypothetical protein [Limisphaerales bacterium]